MDVITTIIGIDCAAQDKNVGLAFGRFDGHECHVSEVTHGKVVDSVAGTVASWISADKPTLIALDAPLGWPAPLGENLHAHKAGEYITAESDMLFSRVTDKIVREKTRKKPLEVGADRIARAARSALNLLNDLRTLTNHPIPLQTAAPIMNDRICAIEVYPAATLIVKGYMQPYKKKEHIEARRSILNSLETQIHFSANRDLVEENDDALDAVICVLAGIDFLRKNVIIPDQSEIQFAEKEGWIWVQSLSH